jgi:hypothetical protein
MSGSLSLLRSLRSRSATWYFCLCLGISAGQVSPLQAAKPSQTPVVQSVLTYHYDNLRTGWNNNETVLTPSGLGNFNLLTSVNVDEQVDAQPLLVPGVSVATQGTHDVLYVATENNSVYAFDATTGTQLLQQNFGTPVPQSALPGQCNLNSQVIGINSTPVIDPASQTMFVVTYTYENNAPVYRVHALNLSNLQEKAPSVIVQASAALQDNSKYPFNPSVNRQRPALVLVSANPSGKILNVYAAFGSFCDVDVNVSRGWLLGWTWKSGHLTPLSTSHLDDQLVTSTNNYFLTAIWMSGYGVAADSSGNLYFATGNSDYSGTSYDPKYNLSESIVKVSSDLTAVLGFFTPSDANFNVNYLDKQDLDTGSGGVMLLPDQGANTPGLAVHAGKVGQMYLFNQNNLGSYDPTGTNHVLGTFPIGACWCGPSYFQGADSAGRVVSSGGNTVMVWRVQKGSNPTLALESQSPMLSTGQDSGFFTSVSSNGTQNAIIWAVARPMDSNNRNVTLYAFDANSHQLITPVVAGTWPNMQGNANLVPVVANGHVYVASYKSVAIFGLGPAGTLSVAAAPQPAISQHEIFGTITALDGASLTIETRTGTFVPVDATAAIASDQSINLKVDKPVRVVGDFNTSGVLLATAITHAKNSSESWPPDH